MFRRTNQRSLWALASCLGPLLASAAGGQEASDGYALLEEVNGYADEEYLLYNLDLGAADFIEQVYAPPRQWGLTARFSW